MAFQAMIEGRDHQRRVRSGKIKFRQVDNLLYLSEENAPSRKVGFPTSNPPPDPRRPEHRLETSSAND
jgi:hypothetical protein